VAFVQRSVDVGYFFTDGFNGCFERELVFFLIGLYQDAVVEGEPDVEADFFSARV
jgi:hypothetical protein